MNGKDLIFVSNAVANGGAGRVLCVLANHFSSLGYNVGILAYRQHPAEFTRAEEVETEYAPQDCSRRQRIAWIRRVVRRNPRAAVVAFEYFVNIDTLTACIGLPNRIVVSERNDPSRVGSSFPSDFARKVLYRTADALVCQTTDAADYFSDSVRKHVILNPIKPDLPDPVVKHRRKTVVTFCRLEPQKNLPLLIRAFAQFHRFHPEYTLEIYGDGAERSALTQLISSMSLTDIAIVLPSRPDIHQAVRDCAMFVLPSNYEGLSNSMIEAMGLGLPTICTDCPCGGARMVIQHAKNGILVPVDDAESLVNAMHQVATDDRYARELGKNAARIRHQLSLESIADQWSRILFDA